MIHSKLWFVGHLSAIHARTPGEWQTKKDNERVTKFRSDGQDIVLPND
jgi:hypothetical protein